MRSFAEKPKAIQQAGSSKAGGRILSHLRHSHKVHAIITRRTIENDVVQRLPRNHPDDPDHVLSDTSSQRVGGDFDPISSSPLKAVTLQTKLVISEPGDRYEQEADRVAEQVMRMPEPEFQRSCACGNGCQSDAGQISREVNGLQTKIIRPGSMQTEAAPPVVLEALQSSGRSIDPATSTYMETRFGHDFSHVRIHSDTAAARSARAVNAKAYTLGRDVVFASGQYTPGTTEGRRLLAHELAHVLQQHGQSVTPRETRRDMLVKEPSRDKPSSVQVTEMPRNTLSRRELIGEEQYTACTDPPYFWPQVCNDRENTRFTPEPVEVMTEAEWREHMRRHDFARSRERTFLRSVYISDARYPDYAVENQRGFFDFTLIDHDVEASRRLDRVPTESEKLAFAKALILLGGARQHDWRFEAPLVARFIRDWQHRVVEGEARAGRIFTREQAGLVIPEGAPGRFFNPAAKSVGLSMIESASGLMMRGLTLYIHSYGSNASERENANRIIQSAGNILRQGAETLDEISAEERRRVEASINVLVDVFSLPGASDLSRVTRSIFKASFTPSIGGALADTDSAVDRMLRIQSGTIQFLENFDYEGHGHTGNVGQDIKEHLQTMIRSLLQ